MPCNCNKKQPVRSNTYNNITTHTVNNPKSNPRSNNTYRKSYIKPYKSKKPRGYSNNPRGYSNNPSNRGYSNNPSNRGYSNNPSNRGYSNRGYYNKPSNRGYSNRRYNKPRGYINNSTKNRLDDYYERYRESKYRSLSANDLRSWDKIHRMAAGAINDESKSEFEKYIRYLSYNFPCSKCRPHIMDRLLNYPISSYYGIKDSNNREIGIAKWSWEFHNGVNERLRKNITSWEVFSKKYL